MKIKYFEKKSKFWIIKNTFNRVEVSVGNQCSKCYTNYTQTERKYYNRYNAVKFRGLQCPADIYLLYHVDSDKLTVYQREVAHKHYNGLTSNTDEDVKKVTEGKFI